MDYRQAYIRLIEKGKRRAKEKLDPNEKYEWHHYFPVCFWKNKQENTKMVPLTLREHWIAHRLLFKMFPCKGTAVALVFMSKRDPKMNSRKFGKIRSTVSEFNWTKTQEGRIFLSQQMKQRWEEGVYDTEKARQARSKRSKAMQAQWKENGNHPLSSDYARQRSSERAKKRNQEMNKWLNKEKAKIVRICDKCGAEIRGPMGNMKQHQRGRKCKPSH